MKTFPEAPHSQEVARDPVDADEDVLAAQRHLRGREREESERRLSSGGATPRSRPTDRQVAAATALGLDALVELALDALHALNRRAKKYRDNVRAYPRASFSEARRAEIGVIYALKTRFLDAAVSAGRAGVETFEHQRQRPPSYSCCACLRDWRGWDSACFDCGGSGSVIDDGVKIERWAVISIGARRWHQPPGEITPAMFAVARPGTAHDPDQLAREIPDVPAEVGGRRLTIAAQEQILELAIERLATYGDPGGRHDHNSPHQGTSNTLHPTVRGARR